MVFDIILDTISKQWENVKSLFSSMLDLFDNLMSGSILKKHLVILAT